MNKFYHYGDSFADCDKSEEIFSKKIAKEFGLSYVNKSGAGKSNEYLLSYLLSDIPKFKKGDKLLINFTFFTRGGFISDDEEFLSTNIIYDDQNKKKSNEHEKFPMYNIELDRTNNLLDFLLNYNWDYYVRLFKFLFLPTIKIIKEIGVDVRYFYVRQYPLNNGSELKPFKNFLPNKYEITFGNDDYITFLRRNRWKNEESIHYTWGIQDKLADVFIDKWNDK